MPSKPIILVTGGTGFVASHIIQQLLAEHQSQYTIRVTTRKEQKVRALFPDAGSKLEVVELPSLVADHSSAVEGVHAVIHCANPGWMNGETGKEVYEGTYEGTINVINTAISAGVKKIVMTGSMVSLLDATFSAAFGSEPLTAHTFGPSSLKDIDLDKDFPASIYKVAKSAAERKVWELAQDHPEIDFTVVILPGVFGPFIPNYANQIKTREGLGSMDIVYQLIVGGSAGPNTYPASLGGHLIDVRDVAKAHIKSLFVPPHTQRKRFLILGKIFTWKEAAAIIRRERPEISARLPQETAELRPQTCVPFDTSLTEAVLGFKQENYVPWEQTMVDSIDALLQWETGIAH